MKIGEYVWIDVNGNTRSKTMVISDDSEFGDWTFDGSSTGQAQTTFSDVILRPVRSFNDPFRKHVSNANCFLVLCETYNLDGTPHFSNNRAKCMKTFETVKDLEPWFGIEQEYFLYQVDGIPYKWVDEKTPNHKFSSQTEKQDNHSICKNKEYGGGSPFYCGCGGDRAHGRNIADMHLEYCLYAGIKICGLNLEVTCSQLEFQIGIASGDEIGDHLWMARYILNRIAEMFCLYINYHPKPLGNLPFNGSGCHTNFSTKLTRQENGYENIIDICEKFRNVHQIHLLEYGDIEQNKKRLSGHHETASYNVFSYGVSDRSASVRIPHNTFVNNCGYLEDRRPSSNCDPYRVANIMMDTISK